MCGLFEQVDGAKLDKVSKYAIVAASVVAPAQRGAQAKQVVKKKHVYNGDINPIL